MLFRIPTLFLSLLLLNGCISLIRGTAEDEAKILFGGDVMLDWGIRDIIEEKGYKYPLRDIRNFLLKFDYRFCNLECPISEEGEPHPKKKYIFLAKPDHINVIKYANINGVSLANNHITDFGKVALQNTMANLHINGIGFTGAGMDIGSSHLPISIEIRGIRLAIFAYSNIAYEDCYATEKSPGIAKATIEVIREDIVQFRQFHDFIIISIHWGEEYSEYPTEKQIIMAHSLIDSGADVIIGHHPHIFQGIEIYNGKPIFYSLGNFIFGSINEDIQDNILVEIAFLRDKIKSLSVHPINGNKNIKKPFRYALLKGDKAICVLSHLLDISIPLGSEFTEKAIITKDSSLLYQFLENNKTDD